jgi:hypothetical protein
MPLLAILDEAAFNVLPDETALGKDSYIKDEKTNTYKLALDGEEAGKLALPLQESVKKLEANNKKLMDEKVETIKKLDPFTKLNKTPEEIAEILKTGKVEGVDELEKKHQAALDSLKTANQSAIDAATAEIEAAKQEAAEIEREHRNTLKRTIIAELKNDFQGAKVFDDYFANRIEIVKDEATGKYVPRVMENGEPAYKAGQFKTPRQLAEEARADKELSGMFNGGTAGGTGAPPRQGGGNQAGVIQVGREESKTNPQLYRNAKEEAEKTGAQIVFTE